MDILPNECIYEIFLFLNPKCLQFCGQTTNNFNELCQLHSLWRNRIDDKHNELFKKENYYQNCKFYHQLDTLRKNLKKYSYEPDRLYSSVQIFINDKMLEYLPKEIGLLINLKYLHLYNNLLKEIPKEIGQLTNLVCIDLSHNQLKELPKEILKLTKLIDLSVNNNQLTHLPNKIKKLINLRTIYLQNNKLTHLPKEMGKLTNLKILLLENNKLTKIPEEIREIPNLIIRA